MATWRDPVSKATKPIKQNPQSTPATIQGQNRWTNTGVPTPATIRGQKRWKKTFVSFPRQTQNHGIRCNCFAKNTQSRVIMSGRRKTTMKGNIGVQLYKQVQCAWSWKGSKRFSLLPLLVLLVYFALAQDLMQLRNTSNPLCSWGWS